MPPIQHNISVRLFESPAAQRQEQARIALLKLDHIGDFITAIEAFRVIRRAFADAEITLICLPATVALAESTGLFDRVKGFNAVPESRQLGKVPKMDSEDQVAAFAALTDGHYLFAADFRHDGSSRLWLDHVDASFRAGFSAPTQKGLDIALPAMEWDVPASSLANKDLPVHAELRLTLLAHAIAETLAPPRPGAALFATPQGLAAAPAYRALESQTRTKIGVSLGAGSELRKWGADYWAALLQRLIQARNAHIVFFGGPGDREETAALAARLAPGAYTDLTGAMGLADVPAYMNLLDAYIGCDTGLTHLAAGLGVPTVDIFAGISNVSVWRARGPRVKTVYAAVICGPCHKRFKSECPNNNVCMGIIVPDIVYACFEQVIAQHPRP